MKNVLVLVAGAVFAAAPLAGVDQFAEQRHLAKYGRNTPAHEDRLKGAPAEAHGMCCHAAHQHEGVAKAGESAVAQKGFTEERFRVKFGRNTPVQEAQRKAAEHELAMHQSKCAELGQCPLMPSHPTAQKAAVVTDTEARLQAKYGRVLQGAEPALEKAEQAPTASMDGGTCGHVCCE